MENNRYRYECPFGSVTLEEDATLQCAYKMQKDQIPQSWNGLLQRLDGLEGCRDFRVFGDISRKPSAVIWQKDGRLVHLGEQNFFDSISGWTEIRQVFWEEGGVSALSERGLFYAVGPAAPLNGKRDICQVLCDLHRKDISPPAILRDKNGTVTLLNRARETSEELGERVDKISLVRFHPQGKSVWVAITKHTHRFITSERQNSISADYFGGSYTEEADPNRYHQRIKDYIAVPRKYLAVLYENGFIRAFGNGFCGGEILCGKAQAIERRGGALYALLSEDCSFAPTLEDDPGESFISAEESSFALGDAADMEGLSHRIESKIELWRTRAYEKVASVFVTIHKAWRDAHNICFLYMDGTASSVSLASGERKPLFPGCGRIQRIVPGTMCILALFEDGSAAASGGEMDFSEEWRDLIDLQQNWYMVAALRRDGRVFVQPFAHSREGCVKEVFCNGHVTVIPETATRDYSSVQNWQDVTQIALSGECVLARRRDGTVVFSGGEDEDFYDIPNWRNIKKIVALDHLAVGLKEDGTLQMAGHSVIANYSEAAEWSGICDLVSYHNSLCSILLGLKEDGGTVVAGRWSADTYANQNGFPLQKWTGLKSIGSDGYYLLGDRKDGGYVYESFPSPDGSEESAEEHILDWDSVSGYVQGNGFLMLLRRDGSVAWEGKKRPTQCKQISDDWQNVCRAALWEYVPRSYFSAVIDKEGCLYADVFANGVKSRQELTDFWKKFSRVLKILPFGRYLTVLHEAGASIIAYENQQLKRWDFPDASEIFLSEKEDTICFCYSDGSVRALGSIIYDSTAADQAFAVRYYGAHWENADDAMKFFYQGIIGIRKDGRPFVWSESNEKDRPSLYYNIEEQIALDSICDVAAVEPTGDFLLRNGCCLSIKNDRMAQWNGILQLSGCPTHTVGLTAFHTLVLQSDSREGQSVERYTAIRQVLTFPYTTVFLKDSGQLFLLCTRYSEMPCCPLPVSEKVAAVARTTTHFAILCENGILWCCEAQHVQEGRQGYFRHLCWSEWHKVCQDALRIETDGEQILVWRRDHIRDKYAPTLEEIAFSGLEPTIL